MYHLNLNFSTMMDSFIDKIWARLKVTTRCTVGVEYISSFSKST